MRVQATNNYYNLQDRSNNKNLKNQNEFLKKQGVKQDDVAFKGKFGDKIGELFGKFYAQKMIDKPWMQKVSEKMSGASKLMTQHMATVGSLLTSAVYFIRTISNKNLEKDKRNTLGINQIGCFVVPTICAYGVDYKLRNFNKRMEYTYSGLKRQQMANGEISAEKCAQLSGSLGKKLKCFGALMGLATFTLIYRYATPVVITPVANKIGEWWNGRNKNSHEEAQQIALNPNKESKQVA